MGLHDSIFQPVAAWRGQQDEPLPPVDRVEEEALLEERPIEYSGFVIVRLVGGALDDPSWLPPDREGTLRQEAERRGLGDIVLLLAEHGVDGERVMYNLTPQEVWEFEYPDWPFPEDRRDDFSNNDGQEIEEPADEEERSDEETFSQDEQTDNQEEPTFAQDQELSDEPASLNLYWRIDMREDPAGAERLVANLYRLGPSGGVGLAYLEMKASPAQFPAAENQIFAKQGYLHLAPQGIAVGEAWRRFAPGQTVNNVRFADVEEGWFLAHPDLPLWVRNVGVMPGANNSFEAKHGVAVLGILLAEHNTIGIFGQTAGFAEGHLQLASNFHEGKNVHIEAAIVGAARQLSAGDVLLIEVERGNQAVELDCKDFAAIYRAVKQGIIVVEAAGNGGVDLDAAYENHICEVDGVAGLRDSGAIVVGACNPRVIKADGISGHSRLSESNYGQVIVDCHAWGSSVQTIDDTGQVWNFNGTSAAAAIIAGAVVLIQSLYKARNPGQIIMPSDMRAKLKNPANGTPQVASSGKSIGPMPDLTRVLPAFGL